MLQLLHGSLDTCVVCSSKILEKGVIYTRILFFMNFHFYNFLFTNFLAPSYEEDLHLKIRTYVCVTLKFRSLTNEESKGVLKCKHLHIRRREGVTTLDNFVCVVNGWFVVFLSFFYCQLLKGEFLFTFLRRRSLVEESLDIHLIFS